MILPHSKHRGFSHGNPGRRVQDGFLQCRGFFRSLADKPIYVRKFLELIDEVTHEKD